MFRGSERLPKDSAESSTGSTQPDANNGPRPNPALQDLQDTRSSDVLPRAPQDIQRDSPIPLLA
eukprot:8974590-Pyramimonas_sp.AAC.1